MLCWGVQYNDRAVVATDRRLLPLRLNFLGRATGLAGEVPRETKLGPCSGFLHPIDAFGTSLAVSFRFFKDVAEADRAAGRLRVAGHLPCTDTSVCSVRFWSAVIRPSAGGYRWPAALAVSALIRAVMAGSLRSCCRQRLRSGPVLPIGMASVALICA